MSDCYDEAMREFIETSVSHGESLEKGNHLTANKAYDLNQKAIKNLRKLPDKGVEFFLKMLKYPNESVVVGAAYCLLPTHEKEARKHLREVEKQSSSYTSFDAEMILKEWDAGRLKIK